MEEPLDGVKAIRTTLNAELLKLNQDLLKKDTDYEFTLNRINEIARTLKKLPKDEEAKEEKTEKNKASKEKPRSIFDAEADKNR